MEGRNKLNRQLKLTILLAGLIVIVCLIVIGAGRVGSQGGELEQLIGELEVKNG